MRIRIRFTKNEIVKYLGHLDIMRTFQRCFNRAGVRMTYSEGFNPHQKMNFALPLGVGISSRGEYLDAEIADGQDPEEIRASLNRVMGDGFDILEVRQVEETAQKAMAAVRYASYDIILDQAYPLSWESYLDRPSILIQKKTKSGIRDVDAGQVITQMSMEGRIIHLMMKAGSEDNLKPELILEDLFRYSGIEYCREMAQICRTDLYGEGMIPLIAYQTV